MARPCGRVPWLIAISLLLVALYRILASSMQDQPSEHSDVATYRLSIPASELTGATQVFKARQGDVVTFMILSDRTGEVHVHGYEKMAVLKQGRSVSLIFTAVNVGAFPLHFHDSKGLMYPLGLLEVQPN